MNCLFIDTSTSSLIVGLIINNKIYERRIKALNEHSKYLISEIDSLFKEVNFSTKDINKIFVINGPGSFTGIRIGLTVAKVYAWALNIEIIPVSTLHAYAVSSNLNKGYYVSAIDARRGYVYAAIYDKCFQPYLEEQYIQIKELDKQLSKLDNFVVLSNVMLNEEYETVEPCINIENIYNFFKGVNGVNVHKLTPNYLKKVEAEEKIGD